MAYLRKNDVKTTEQLKKYIDDITRSEVKRLYHYTTYESLLKILKFRSIRLSRIDLMNDKAEQALSKSNINEDRYILSFTNNSKEYVSMWAMYGKASGIKLRIDFPIQVFRSSINDNFFFNEQCTDKIPIYKIATNFVTKKDFIINDVIYYDKQNNKIKHNTNPFNYLEVMDSDIDSMAGFIKYDAWEFERETRLSVLLENIRINDDIKNNNIRYIYARINDELIKNMGITYNPWISELLKTELQKSIDEVANYELNHNLSANNGEIAEI